MKNDERGWKKRRRIDYKNVAITGKKLETFFYSKVLRFFFTYLVAKSLCTKFICSKYFIPEAICVAMYIKQP